MTRREMATAMPACDPPRMRRNSRLSVGAPLKGPSAFARCVRYQAADTMKTGWLLNAATTHTNLVDPECFSHTAVTKEWRDPFAARRHAPCR
jgi:hypothetical protein